MSIFHRTLLLLIIASQVPLGIYAQVEQTKDTLDWRGYYPLEIGNIWEWKTHQDGIWFGGDLDISDHREIVADTMINDQQYFVQVAYAAVDYEVNGERAVSVWREYLRYDTSQARILQFHLDQRQESSYTCDLSADFNSSGTCFEFVSGGASGGYASDQDFQVAVGSEQAPFNAVKAYVGLTGGFRYFHGIGRLPVLGDGSEDGTVAFNYVKVRDNEYGARSIHVGVEETVTPERTVIELYPNPVTSQLHIVASKEVHRIEAKIVDVLGRSAPVVPICAGRKCQVDVSTLSPGIYVLQYSGLGQVVGSKAFVVIRSQV